MSLYGLQYSEKFLVVTRKGERQQTKCYGKVGWWRISEGIIMRSYHWLVSRLGKLMWSYIIVALQPWNACIPSGMGSVLYCMPAFMDWCCMNTTAT